MGILGGRWREFFILGKLQACLLSRRKIRKKLHILGFLVLLDGNIM
jgi:hypothetical protein